MSGSDSEFQRSSEDRARAAAERAARRAARAGKPIPPVPHPGAGSFSAGAPDDVTRVHEPVVAPARTDAPTGQPLPAAGHEPVAAPAPVGEPLDAPAPVGEPIAAPHKPDQVVGPTVTPAPPATGNRTLAAPLRSRRDDTPATAPPTTAMAGEDRTRDPGPAPRPGRQDVPLASAKPLAATTAQRSGRRGRSRGGPPVKPEGGSPGGARWGRRLLALVALAAIGGALYLINATFQPFHDSGRGAVRVNIPEGADVAGIGAVLERRGVVDSGRFFNANVTLTGRRGKLRPGDYTLRQDMSYGDASEALLQGPKVRVVETFDLTIPEGRSLREVAALVADSPVRGRYVRAAGERRFLRRAREMGLPAQRDTLEGFLFPATYQLTGDADVRDLIGKQLDAFEQNFASVPMKRAKRRNLTRYDVLIIASMVEREAALSKERPLIAAVIHNRLRAGMPLGIDATIRYATDNWERPIRVSELEKDGPYNSRLRRGLPPTPIGNPGLDSMKAAANPADVDHLYYVVKPGTCGEHAFSSSDADFQRDSARYNAERAAAGGKSPTTC